MREATTHSAPDESTQIVSLPKWLALGILVFIACEVGARLDDFFFDDIPLQANPTYEGLFTVNSDGIRQGKPNAAWKKVTLNSFGFRSPEVSKTRPSNCERWAFLGASETFGEPSVRNMEYPAKLASLRYGKGCTEILNTAFAGLGPPLLPAYYTSVVAQYSPTKVFIYPSTQLYLGSLKGRKAPGTPATTPAQPTQARPESKPSLSSILNALRIYERARDSLHMPAFIQKRRVQGWIDNSAKGKGPEWFFSTVPQERLDFLVEDLTELLDAIRKSGAEPVLMTHAVRSTHPPRPEDQPDLFAMRVYVPQASEAVIAEYDYVADEKIRELARATNTRLIDIAKAIDGKRNLFIDLVHFSPEGHAEVARLIDTHLPNTLPGDAR